MINVPILIFHQLKDSESKISCYRDPSFNYFNIFKEIYGLNTIICDRRYLRNDQNKKMIEKFQFFDVSYTTQREMIDNIKVLYSKLMNEKICVILNSALGVAKCSTLIYCLLRLNGETKESAREIFLKMRDEKKNGIGDYRIEYNERYILPHLLK
jgi:hypothetical protein